MNADRRRTISGIEGKLSVLKDTAANLNKQIEDVKSDEEEAKDNLPESMQQGDKGEAMDTCISNLESATEQVDDIVSSVKEALEYLEAAREGE